MSEEANRYAEFFGLDESFNTGPGAIADLLEAAKRAAAEAKRKAAEEAARIRRENAARIGQWLNGDNVQIPWGLPEAYLRINGDTVETTKGATVPLSHVQRAMPVVLRLIEHGKTYQRNGHSIHIGHYTLDRVDDSGNVYAGCHYFTRSEIERFANVLKSATVATV